MRRSPEWNNLDGATREILERFVSELPVKLGALANSLGIEVRTGTLRPRISGEIKPHPLNGNRYLIRVNKHEGRPRQRFTLAHEIAHFLLHRDLIGSGVTDDVLYRSTLSNSIEAQANRLAADILMPYDDVLKVHSKLGGSDDDETLQSVAEHFGVSLPAIKVRLGLV